MSETLDLPSWVTADSPFSGVMVIRLHRPERMNALNMVVKRQIEHHIGRFVSDPTARIAVITGSDKVFVAGTDIAEMQNLSAIDHTTLGTGHVFTAIRDCPKPIIAAVEGYALGGGCELALACDMIVAAKSAIFGQPEIRVGIMPGAGGTQMLLRTVGKYRAMLLCLTGEQVNAADAYAMGLVSELVEPGLALTRSLELAQKIVRMPPLAVLAIKEAIKLGQDSFLTAGLSRERKSFELMFDTTDQKEGMQAFIDKRQPSYNGS